MDLRLGRLGRPGGVMFLVHKEGTDTLCTYHQPIIGQYCAVSDQSEAARLTFAPVSEGVAAVGSPEVRQQQLTPDNNRKQLLLCSSIYGYIQI